MTGPPVDLAAETLRLFPGVSPGDLERVEAADFVIGRLMEEGDRQDLRWLRRHFGEVALADWLGQRGARQLSRRSHAFWSLILSLPQVDTSDDSLWPL